VSDLTCTLKSLKKFKLFPPKPRLFPALVINRQFCFAADVFSIFTWLMSAKVPNPNPNLLKAEGPKWSLTVTLP